MCNCLKGEIKLLFIIIYSESEFSECSQQFVQQDQRHRYETKEEGDIFQRRQTDSEYCHLTPFMANMKKHLSLNELDQFYTSGFKFSESSRTFTAYPCQIKGTSSSCLQFDEFDKVSKETQTDIPLGEKIKYPNESITDEQRKCSLSYNDIDTNQNEQVETCDSDANIEKDRDLEEIIEAPDTFIPLIQHTLENSGASEKKNVRKLNKNFEYPYPASEEMHDKVEDPLNIDGEEIQPAHNIQTTDSDESKFEEKSILQNRENEMTQQDSEIDESDSLNTFELSVTSPNQQTVQNGSQHPAIPLLKEDACIEMLKEMKNALLNITELLKEEHSDKTANFVQVADLINHLRYGNNRNEKSTKTTPNSIHDINITEYDLPIIADFSNLVQCKQLKRQENTKTDDDESLIEEKLNMQAIATGYESFKVNREKFTENHDELSNYIIEDIIDNIIKQVQISQNQDFPKVSEEKDSKDETENELILVFKEKHLSPQPKQPEKPCPKVRMGINVKKIISSIEERSNQGQILNEHEVKEILNHGKEKIDSIINCQIQDSMRPWDQTFEHPISSPRFFENREATLTASEQVKDSEIHLPNLHHWNIYDKYIDDAKTNLSNSPNSFEQAKNMNIQRVDSVDYVSELEKHNIVCLNEDKHQEEDSDYAEDKQKERESLVRSLSETHLNKKELKFSISTDDLDSDELLSIQFVGDKINVTTSSRAFASSTIDVTSTEGGFNFRLKSRSQSQVNCSSKRNSLLTEKNFTLDDIVSPCPSALENTHSTNNLDGDLKDQHTNQNEFDNNEAKEIEETCRDEKTIDISTQKDSITEHHDENPVECLNVEDDFTLLDDSCSIDTVIENKYWKEKGKKSDSLLNWDYIDECSTTNEENVCLNSSDLEGAPNFLSLASSYASSDGNLGVTNLDKLSYCSQFSSDQRSQDANAEEIDYFEEQQILARPTMFMAHKELYCAPKVRSILIN